MKTFILALFLSVACTFVQAQAISFVSTTNSTAIDTVTNTGVRSQKGAINYYQDVITIVSTVTEISGTTAGNIKCYGSLDNTNWVLVDSTTFNPVDQATAQSFAWKINPSQYPYYQTTYTGAGTMSAIFSTKALARKQ